MRGGRNWGRWGAEDERGALNLVSPAAVRAAAALVRRGDVVALAQRLDGGTPVAPGHGGVEHRMLRDGGDYLAGARSVGGSQFAEDTLALHTHVGTHVDAFAHVWAEGRLYNGVEQATVRSSGARHCGVERLGPIVSRGLLLDVRAELGPESAAAGREISAPELAAAARRGGREPRPGDVVLVRTGWLEEAGDDPARYFAGEPGLGVEAASWLADRDVAAVGADNYGVEAFDGPRPARLPVHELFLRDCGIPMLEGLVLAELASLDAAAEFLFVAAPLPITGATASPLTPVAVL